MGENTNIEWAHHSWSPWIGCTRVSQGCKHCYAEEMMTRKGRWADTWGPRGKRVRTSDAYWKKPLRWNRQAEDAGTRFRVFPSLCDPFDEHESIEDEWMDHFFTMMEAMTHLDWLLLTKRPEEAPSILPQIWMERGIPENIWIGTSVENQEMADQRIPELLKIPAAIRFLSCEPLLGPIDIDRAMYGDKREGMNAFGFTDGFGYEAFLHWVIVGGESGSNARPMNVQWAFDIIQQCQDASVPVFMKQMGSRPTFNGRSMEFKHSKGGDMNEWSTAYRIRQFPKVAGVVK